MCCAVLTASVLMAGFAAAPAARAGGAIPVKTTTVHFVDYSPYLIVTGDVEARHQIDVAFRVSGRVSERLVEVGDHVTSGQLLARLEPKEKKADLEAAEASVTSKNAVLKQASLTMQRQKSLLDKGFTTRSDFDSAQESYRVAQETLKVAEANLSQAKQNLDDTNLRAEEDGVITARSVEVGQVVQPGTAVFSIARDGGRDAVFRVFEALFANKLAVPDFSLKLISDPSVTAEAHVREISPAIDEETGTVKLKATIKSPPPQMTLGAPISGTAKFAAETLATLPWTALSSINGNPAVWIVSPKDQTVRLQPVTIARHETGRFFVSKGLKDGDIVVTAGGQYLYAGVRVEITEAGNS